MRNLLEKSDGVIYPKNLKCKHSMRPLWSLCGVLYNAVKLTAFPTEPQPHFGDKWFMYSLIWVPKNHKATGASIHRKASSLILVGLPVLHLFLNGFNWDLLMDQIYLPLFHRWRVRLRLRTGGIASWRMVPGGIAWSACYRSITRRTSVSSCHMFICTVRNSCRICCWIKK